MRKEEKELSAKEVASQLEVAESTLRRWLNILHAHGYTFSKEGNRRKLYERDLIVLCQVKELNQSMTLEEACGQVCKKKQTKRSTVNHGKEVVLPEKEPSVDYAELIQQLKQFDQSMADLSKMIYWQGTTITVESLKSQWEQFKQEMLAHFNERSD